MFELNIHILFLQFIIIINDLQCGITKIIKQM